MGRLTQDHRQTKEGQGSNPNRLPIPKLSVNNLFIYSEPAVVYQGAELKAVVPNRDVWYNFLRDTKTNNTDLLSTSGDASVDTTNNFIGFTGSGTITWLLYKFPGRDINRVLLDWDEGEGRNLNNFLGSVDFEVSNDNNTWHTVESNTRFDTPIGWDTVYLRLSSDFAEQYFIRSTGFGPSEEEGFEVPLRVSLR